MTSDREQKPIEDMTTTAAYVLTIGQVRWIEEQARRLGTSRSELVRDILNAAMESRPAPVAERVA